MKHQKPARRAKPVMRTPEPSTEKRCGHPSRVNIDVGEHEVWHCVKDAGHQDNHYAENADGSAGMAITLSAVEKRYWAGFNAGVASAERGELLNAARSIVRAFRNARPEVSLAISRESLQKLADALGSADPEKPAVQP